MLYLCIPSHNEAPTLGLLLWKIRKTLEGFPREYEILVTDDGSTDATVELLEPYTRALPLTVLRHPEPLGYARSVEAMLRLAVERSDRPRRDAAVVLHADFAHNPDFLPEIVRRLESGADVVVTQATIQGEPRWAARLVRRLAPWLVRGIRVSGVRDTVSGFAAFRLHSLRQALRVQQGPLLTSEGWVARAELLARVAGVARRVETVPTVERHDRRSRPSRFEPWTLARLLWREGGKLRLRVARPDSRRAGGPRGLEPELELEEVSR